jgi:peptidoglycan/xylan/chitin deacetylase (PgdA/CDA1 family)
MELSRKVSLGGIMDQLRIRIDDVLVHSKEWNADERFAQVTRWLEKTPLIRHVPTILVQDIKEYPKTLDLVIEKTKEGKMFPELHGLTHIDYNKLDEVVVRQHLEKSVDWFEKNLGFKPKVWATPWGAEGEKLTKVAGEFGMIVEGVGSCVSPGQWLAEARKHSILSMEHTVMDHWWTRGLRLLRIAHVLSYGSYAEAAKNEDIF